MSDSVSEILVSNCVSCRHGGYPAKEQKRHWDLLIQTQNHPLRNWSVKKLMRVRSKPILINIYTGPAMQWSFEQWGKLKLSSAVPSTSLYSNNGLDWCYRECEMSGTNVYFFARYLNDTISTWFNLYLVELVSESFYGYPHSSHSPLCICILQF